MSPLQTTHRPSTREEMVIFCLKVHLPRQPHIALSCFLHLIFQNCLCRAQNWEGRTKVSLVIATKRREHSPIRITLKCTTPRARCKVQTTPERGWGGKCQANKTKGKQWLEGKLVQAAFEDGLKIPTISLSPAPSIPAVTQVTALASSRLNCGRGTPHPSSLAPPQSSTA